MCLIALRITSVVTYIYYILQVYKEVSLKKKKRCYDFSVLSLVKGQATLFWKKALSMTKLALPSSCCSVHWLWVSGLYCGSTSCRGLCVLLAHCDGVLSFRGKLLEMPFLHLCNNFFPGKMQGKLERIA